MQQEDDLSIAADDSMADQADAQTLMMMWTMLWSRKIMMKMIISSVTRVRQHDHSIITTNNFAIQVGKNVTMCDVWCAAD